MKKNQFKGIPTFRIKDYEKAIAFYVDLLGFNIDWEHRFGESEPIYMQISNNGLILHLSENERFKTGFIVYVETKELESFRNDLVSRNDLIPEIILTKWNSKLLELTDPFGNLLRFDENLAYG